MGWLYTSKWFQGLLDYYMKFKYFKDRYICKYIRKMLIKVIMEALPIWYDYCIHNEASYAKVLGKMFICLLLYHVQSAHT